MSEQNGNSKRRFSGRRWQEEIEIELSDGSVKTLIVRELMGDQRDEFLSYQASRVKLAKDGTPTGLRDLKGTTVKLLSLGLYEPDAAIPLTEEQVRSLKLPSRVETDLVELISQKSGLIKPEKEDPNS